MKKTLLKTCIIVSFLMIFCENTISSNNITRNYAPPQVVGTITQVGIDVMGIFVQINSPIAPEVTVLFDGNVIDFKKQVVNGEYTYNKYIGHPSPNQYYFYVNDVNPKDSGTYTFRFTTNFGSCQTSVRMNITPKV